MSNTVGKGALILAISGVVCKFFGALFRLPLTNIVGIEGIALFQMVMTVYSFALVFVSGGVTSSLSKLISSARAKGQHDAVGAYLKHACIFAFAVSAVFCFAFVVFAPQIAHLQGAYGGEMSYRVLAILVPLGAAIGIARGILQGYGNMSPTAVSQIIEQILKFAFGLIFAYLFKQQGSSGGVFGAMLGIVLSEVFACVYLGLKMFRLGKLSLLNLYRKQFYSATLPLTFGSIVVPLTHTIEALFIVQLFALSGISTEVGKTVYGLQTGVVGAILNFPLIISLALASSLLPNISFLAERNDLEGQKRTIAHSVSAMWFLLIPLVFGIVAVSKNVYPIIYPVVMQGNLELASQLTALNGFVVISTALMQLLVAILQANGFFKQSMIFYIIGGIAKLIVLVLISLIPSVAPFAIGISNFALAAVVAICAIIKMRMLISIPAFELILPILSAIVMFMVVRILLNLLPSILGIGMSIVIGGLTYFVLAFPLTSGYLKILGASMRKQHK